MKEQELREYIDKYVDDEYFDKKKLFDYLSLHQMVGNEIFQYCDKGVNKKNGRKAYSQWLDDREGYYPLYKDSFIQRIPFYFFVNEQDIGSELHSGTLDGVFMEYYKDLKSKEDKDDLIEGMYQDLLYLFYEKHLDLYTIFNYMLEQTGKYENGIFRKWVDYIHICDEIGSQDYCPERFVSAYNEALLTIGREAIIYEVIYDCRDGVYERDGDVLTFEGIFPCDKDGKPIMEWIGIRFENANVLSCSCEKSEMGYLRIQLKPEAKVYAYGVYDDLNSAEKYWYSVYTGPLHMEFNFECLKDYREMRKLTQQQLADAIGANVRTYQKWENGTTTPDCQNLIRLINWLDIRDIQELIKYE